MPTSQIPPCSIQWKDRPPLDRFQKGCAAVGIWLLLLQIGVSAYFVYSRNGYLDPEAAINNQCPEGYNTAGFMCVTDALFAQGGFTICADRGNSEWFTRQLEASSMDHDVFSDDFLAATRTIRRRLADVKKNMWDQLAENVWIPQMAAILVLVVGVAWVLVLQRIPRPCIYAGFITPAVVFAIMAIFPTFHSIGYCDHSYSSLVDSYPIASDQRGFTLCTQGGGIPTTKNGNFQVVFLVPAIVILIATYLIRDKIEIAAICISKCSIAFRESPSILLASLGVLGAFAIYEGMWIGFAVNIFGNYKWTCSGPDRIVVAQDNHHITLMMSVLMVPSYILFEMLLTVVVSCGVGGWYFDDDKDLPKTPALEGLRWAGTSSFGAVVLSTVIAWPIVETRNKVFGNLQKFKFLPCFPCFYLYFVLLLAWTLLLENYLCFTRFMLISHTFHGGDMFVIARNMWAVLKKHLGGAVVTDSVVAFILGQGASLLSIGFAIGSWGFMETAVGDGFLADLFSGTDSGAGFVWVAMAFMTISWFCNHSLWAIVITGFISSLWIGEESVKVHGFMVGIFIGAVSNIIFSFLAKCILVGADTMLYCFALEAQHGKTPSRESLVMLHEMIKEHLIVPMPESIVEAEEEHRKRGEEAKCVSISTAS
eukprot:GEMP01006865.1.p1 GENE.GEMP01006865.1~~GEMP01006865.1.p1  ORF type:complete len:650 (+),score=98.44 GEMP01006865.1:103-2052(+)